jgi:hypothetical protein
MPKLVKLLVIFVLPLLLSVSNVKPVLAAVDSCTVTTNPSNISPNSSGNLTFTITNGAASVVIWAKITSPSSSFVINSGSADGFSGAVSGSSIVFSAANGGFLGANVAGDFVVNTTTTTGSQGTWAVELSDSADGSNAVRCTGETRVAISTVAADTVSPSFVGDLTISNLSDTTATFGFTTNESTTAVANYGGTTSYGSSATSTLNTTHSIVISSLTANTTYHYKITITDAAGNSTETLDNTFVTARQGSTVTVTTVVTTTKNVDVTRYIADTTLPTITLNTDFSKIYKVSPNFTGTATDNVGIAKINYSLDGGLTWAPVDNIDSVGSKQVTYSFRLGTVDDGNYKIRVEAIDTSSNIKMSSVYTLIIDRLPPQIGPNIISIGALSLSPDQNGVVYVTPGLDLKITLSAVGGPITIDLISGSQMYSLTKNIDSGLWEGTISFSKEGDYRLIAKSIDGAGSVTTRSIGNISVLPVGKVLGHGVPLQNAVVTVYRFDSTFKQFTVWNGASYGQNNPQNTAVDGSYKLILPAGKYFMHVSADGYKSLNTNIFELQNTTPINSSFNLNMTRTFQIGAYLFQLPELLPDLVNITLERPKNTLVRNEDVLIGKEFPGFNLKFDGKDINNMSLRGKPTIVTLLNSWSPQTFSQLPVLEALQKLNDINVLVIFPQESESIIKLLKVRGGYSINMASDADGITIVQTNIENLPAHFFLDRRGIVRKIKSGILNTSDLVDTLIN